MNNYVTGSTIRKLREKQGLTQLQLAEKLCVSDKAVSKWETGKGFPDISLIEALANILRVSVPELLSGEQIINANRSANILKSNLYVCPICGNIFHSTGSAMISCCGVTLPALEVEQEESSIPKAVPKPVFSVVGTVCCTGIVIIMDCFRRGFREDKASRPGRKILSGRHSLLLQKPSWLAVHSKAHGILH